MPGLKKRTRMLLLIGSALVLAVVLYLDVFRAPAPPRPLLTVDEVTAAVERFDVPCVLSESETQSADENHVMYTLRHPMSDYVPGGAKWLTGSLSSFIRDEQGGLYAQFLSESIPGYTGKEDIPFVWADWKQQIVMATSLYGGFEDEEELYRAVCAQSAPEDGSHFRWNGQLSGAYCSVSWSSSSLPTTVHTPDRYIVDVRFYQTKNLYDRLEQELADILAEKAAKQAETAN